MPSKREISESIQIILEGGVPNDEPKFSLRQILQHVNDCIAFLAKESAYENSNLEGVTFAYDEFISTYKNLPILTDQANGQKYIDLPATPIGLPRGRGIARVLPSSSYKSLVFKPITVREATRFYGLPSIPGKIFYYPESGSLKFVGCPLAGVSSLDISMITPGANNLDDDLSIPPDYIYKLKQMVVAQLRQEGPIDATDDGYHYTSNDIN